VVEHLQQRQLFLYIVDYSIVARKGVADGLFGQHLYGFLELAGPCGVDQLHQVALIDDENFEPTAVGNSSGVFKTLFDKLILLLLIFRVDPDLPGDDKLILLFIFHHFLYYPFDVVPLANRLVDSLQVGLHYRIVLLRFALGLARSITSRRWLGSFCYSHLLVLKELVVDVFCRTGLLGS
jgi:hypothetical protein